MLNSSKLHHPVAIRRLLSSHSQRSRLHHWPRLSSRLQLSKPCRPQTTSHSTMRRISTFTSRQARARLIPVISLTNSNSSRTRLLPNRRRSSSSSRWDQLSHKAYHNSWRIRRRAAVEPLCSSSRRWAHCESPLKGSKTITRPKK